MKKKILLVITKSNWGGAQKYVFDIATRLPEEQFDVAVLYGGEGILASRLKAAGIRTHSIEKLWRDVHIIEDIKSFFTLISFFRKEKPDTIHLNSSKIGALGALAGRIAGIKNIIFTVHGWAFNEKRSGYQKILIKSISWLTVALSTTTIFISQHEYTQTKKWPFVSKKLKLIYNGIVAPEFKSKNEARAILADKCGIDASVFAQATIVGTIAELTANKGLGYALEAMRGLKSEMPNLRFCIIGEGDQRPVLEQKVHEYDLAAQVYLCGNIDMAAQYLKAFDVFLLSSVKEGMPYVILEAALAEVPVIATRVGGIEEMTHNQATLIAPHDSAAIATTIKETIFNQAAASAQAARLKKYIEEHYSVDTMLNDTSKLYFS